MFPPFHLRSLTLHVAVSSVHIELNYKTIHYLLNFCLKHLLASHHESQILVLFQHVWQIIVFCWELIVLPGACIAVWTSTSTYRQFISCMYYLSICQNFIRSKILPSNRQSVHIVNFSATTTSSRPSARHRMKYVFVLLWDVIQLTNGIPWNGKFYFRDVITITRAKGEGNGNFYHIEVIYLPFHRLPFINCFISLIDNMKKQNFIEK